MKRRSLPELLDTDSGTEEEIRASFSDLRWFNRWFGGLEMIRRLLRKVVRSLRQSHLSLLEVAAGDGYVPQVLNQELRQTGLELNIVLLDRRASHLPANRSLAKIAGDALHLPFRDESFDVVCCSLFLHHLSPDDAVAFLREALRVSRLAVLVHDLVRHPLHLALAYLGVPLYRSRVTRNDAPASVWQAYTTEEMRSLLHGAGVTRLDIEERYLFRMGAIAWK